MRAHRRTLSAASAASAASAVALLSPLPALAQDVADESDSRRTVVITGTRASLATAQSIKREKMEIVDSVVADDILKLPDFSVTEALQRITGVQIARDRGEGTGVTVRGLTQMETTLNGREVFTAGSGRTLDFSDFPAELVAGLDVYKTTSADQIEGGVGGLVDLRTRRPFDFSAPQVVFSARQVHGDLAHRSEPQVSTLLSHRWRIAGAGEVGALISASVQKRAYREDQKSAGNPVLRNDLIAGQTVVAPNGTTETSSVGVRKRSAVNLALQWRPSETLELYAEGSFAELRTTQDSQQINVLSSSTFLPGSVQLFPGTSDLQRITWTNAPVSVLSFARDTIDRTRQVALGGRFSSDPWTLRPDLSHTKSFNNLFFSGPFLAATAAQFTHDLSSRLPGTTVSGTDLLDPSNFRYTGLAYRLRPFDGHLTTLTLDADRSLEGLVHTLSAGVRVARRGAGNAPGLIFGDVGVTGVSADDQPAFAMPNPFNDFFRGKAGPSIGNYIAGNLDLARDPRALRDAFGIATPLPTAASPLSVWDIAETTQAAYVVARFKASSAPLDGNVGLRMVHTHEAVSGTQSAPTTGSTSPLSVDTSYTDWLPSATLRYQPAEGLVLRAAASRSVTRPNFDQLSPSLTLVPNPVNPSLNQGGAGNPGLRPVRSTNFDFSIERYFSPASSVYLTLFTKRVNGFVASVSSPEVHDGAIYQVVRPQNSSAATITGAEVGVQRFFDFLPGALRGLGVQANYTYIDSRTPNASLGGNVPLQNLSRNSANFIGLYEHGPVSARLAWNWRDRFMSGVTNLVGVGSLPIYTQSYAWLDASLSYRIGERVTIGLDATNLLDTMRRSNYGTPTRPQSNWLNDRQLGVSLTLKL